MNRWLASGGKRGSLFGVGLLLACAPPKTLESPRGGTVEVPHPPLSRLAENTRTELGRFTAEGRIALGHQDAVAYGVGWRGERNRSDVEDVCGRPPKVLGFDLGHLELEDAEANLDGVPFSLMRDRILENYENGAIITVSWHLRNLGTGGDAWDTSRGASTLLPGGAHHGRLRSALGRARRFFASLRTRESERVPILFRPLHEHNGDWFWWGRGATSEPEYVALFRTIVAELRRDEEGNADSETALLVAHSPSGSRSATRDEYLWAYPGDDVVDVLGVDHYYDDEVESLLVPLRVAVGEAESRGKVAALTEFGPKRENYDARPRWLLEDFWEPLRRDPVARRIAYALAWRNDRPAHAFLPYPGHPSSAALGELCARDDVVLGARRPSD